MDDNQIIKLFFARNEDAMRKLFRMAHHAKQQVQGFFTYLCKNLAPEQRMEGRKAVAFKAFCVVQYAL